MEGFVGAVPKQMYRDDLTSLFKALEQLNAYHGQQNPASMAVQQNIVQQNIVQQNIAQQNTAQQNAAQGAVQNGFQSAPLPNNPAPAAGVILLVLEYSFAIQGLKTKKKGLAVATIVLASVSIVFLMFALALNILLA